MQFVTLLLLLTTCASYAQLNQIPSRPTLPLELSKLPDRAGTVITTGAMGHNNFTDQLPAHPNYPESRIPDHVGLVSAISPKIEYTVAIKPDGRATWWGDPWLPAAAGLIRYLGPETSHLPDAELWDPPPLAWLTGLPPNIVHYENGIALDIGGKVLQAVGGLPYRADLWSRFSVTRTPMPPGLTNVVQIAGGNSFSAALNRDGSVAVWGVFVVHTNIQGWQPVGYQNWHYRPAAEVLEDAFGSSGLTGIVQISAPQDYHHLLALRADGTVTGLGYARAGYAGSAVPVTNTIPPTLSNVVRIQAGNYFDMAIKSNGTLVGWPEPQILSGVSFPSEGFMEKVGAATNVVKVAVGNAHASWLTTDGKVSSVHVLEGYSSLELPSTYPQTNTASWSNVVDITAGGLRTYAIVLPSNDLSVKSSADGVLVSTSGSFTFPTAVVGVAQKTHPFIVQNTGALPTTFGARLLGQGAQDFEVVGLSGNITLQPGTSTNVQVRFAPRSAGANKTAQLSISGNSVESITELRGDAVSPQTDTNGISPAVRHILRDFNVDLDHATQGTELLSSLGLYTPLSIRDLSLGAQMIQKSGSNAIVELRLQTTDDLAKTPFTDYQRITNSVPMPGNKGFLRVRAGEN
jgi:hypothetical protein